MRNIEVIFENKRLEKDYFSFPKNDVLGKKITKIIGEIKKNPAYGKQIPSHLIPKEYIKKALIIFFGYKLIPPGDLFIL